MYNKHAKVDMWDKDVRASPTELVNSCPILTKCQSAKKKKKTAPTAYMSRLLPLFSLGHGLKNLSPHTHLWRSKSISKPNGSALESQLQCMGVFPVTHRPPLPGLASLLHLPPPSRIVDAPSHHAAPQCLSPTHPAPSCSLSLSRAPPHYRWACCVVTKDDGGLVVVAGSPAIIASEAPRRALLPLLGPWGRRCHDTCQCLGRGGAGNACQAIPTSEAEARRRNLIGIPPPLRRAHGQAGWLVLMDKQDD